ncbi:MULTISPECIES: bifunctional hydroxymethylpyrimidine kinase/phosphomethylpyrimidine kinase [Sporosarcina]|uniref:bifunctional hydroxymethylpyrimidine kinase/phosphomethylpyrimidine kinase n=1 Tax=Sporosarcina TaxID=1569 RepID=UPI00058B8CFF|nr:MULTISPECIES: bifunctional hydroxymethylpyrimidine kinase/phosphomethylpyrimidine kinase [Sporosarcina]WJY26957.1 bifunctional hydroxymethylpyrimidine kinase/phosphomethylpyrimidine kinase [Sporosarcina sp. 0.2-SM1T-5]
MTSVALTIAGSDSGGGAGIQADLKTFQELGVFGTSVLTAITAQNTRGVHAVQPVEPAIVQAQLDAVFSDFPVRAVKTGMLYSAELIEMTAEVLRSRKTIPLVIDPVMIAKGGASLLQEEAVRSLRHGLLPLAALVTPNIPEAEVLTGMTIRSAVDMENAARQLLGLGASAVLLKGGHRTDVPFAEDLFLSADGTSFLMRSSRIDTQHTHGTGCTFAAAITAELAKGHSLQAAARTAKQFIQLAIEHAPGIGSGHGPTNHAAWRVHNDARTEGVELIASN